MFGKPRVSGCIYTTLPRLQSQFWLSLMLWPYWQTSARMTSINLDLIVANEILLFLKAQTVRSHSLWGSPALLELIGHNIQLSYRNLNYKAQKFAMVLTSLDIHRINGSQTTLVFFCPVTSWFHSSAIVCWTRSWARNLKVESQWGSTLSHLQCCFQAISTHWNF